MIHAADPPSSTRAGHSSYAPFPPHWLAPLLATLNEANVGIWYWPDLRSDAMWWSPGAYRMLGMARGDVSPSLTALQDLLHPADLALLDARFGELVLTGRPQEYEAEYRLRHRSGRYLWCHGIVATAPAAAPGRSAAFGIVRLIDADALAGQTALRASEQTLDAVLEEIGEVILFVAPDGRIRQANRAAAERLGLGAEQLVGRPLGPLLGSDSLAQEIERMLRVAAGGRRCSATHPCRGRHWAIDFVPIRLEATEDVRIVLRARDVTSERAAEAERLAREKALAETLIREVHHRIKNHLQGLVGLLRTLGASGQPAAEVVDRAVAQVLSIATVHGLLSAGSRRDIEVCALADSVIALARPVSHVPIEADLAPLESTLPSEQGVPVALAMSELLTNAVKRTPPDPTALIRVTLGRQAGAIVYEVRNSPARLSAAAAHPGDSASGLGLARTLLAGTHARLCVRTQDGGVVATLTLAASPTEAAGPRR